MTEHQKPEVTEVKMTTEPTVTTVTSKSGDYFHFRRSVVYVIVAGFIATVLIFALAFYRSYTDQVRTTKTATEQLAAVSDDLREARRDLKISDQRTKDLETCRLRYSSAISEAQGRLSQELANLIVDVGNQVRPLDFTALDKASVDLTAALDERAQYEKDGAPIPCPKPQG